jgi:glycerol kinase
MNNQNKSSSYYLTIDQGGHASRAIVFDNQANIVSQAETAIETFTPKPDWVEHDAEALVCATQIAIDKAVEQLGDDRHRIKAAGLATQRSSIVCWHKQSNAALSPILSWQDRRQAEWLTQFQDKNRFIHTTTGLFLSPHYGASKMRWCLENIEAVQLAQRQNKLVIGPLASFLTCRLLRESPLLADPANASRTLLWNMETGDWDDALLQLFGLPGILLPNCVPSRYPFGYLHVDSMDIPLQIVTGDQSAALFAWGNPDPETVYLNIGTGAFIQRPLSATTDHPRLLTGIAYQDDTYRCYTLEGTVNGAARALHRFAEQEGIDNLEQRVTAAMISNKTPPLFINAVSGLGSPDWIATLESHFIGEGDTEARLLAVVESIAFLIQRNLDAMANTPPQAERIIVSGGLAGLDGLCQLIADLAGVTVIRPQQLEASATGLACLIAARPVDWPTATQRADHFSPDPDTTIKQRYTVWSQQLNRAIAESP